MFVKPCKYYVTSYLKSATSYKALCMQNIENNIVNAHLFKLYLRTKYKIKKKPMQIYKTCMISTSQRK